MDAFLGFLSEGYLLSFISWGWQVADCILEAHMSNTVDGY